MIKTETKSGVFSIKKHQNCKRKMEIIKECGVCGKEFVASKMSVKYCCRGCERVAFRRREAEKNKREKENAESLRNAERNNSLRDKAFLSPEREFDVRKVLKKLWEWNIFSNFIGDNQRVTNKYPFP